MKFKKLVVTSMLVIILAMNTLSVNAQVIFNPATEAVLVGADNGFLESETGGVPPRPA